jgi:hypothetical protein
MRVAVSVRPILVCHTQLSPNSLVGVEENHGNIQSEGTVSGSISGPPREDRYLLSSDVQGSGRAAGIRPAQPRALPVHLAYVGSALRGCPAASPRRRNVKTKLEINFHCSNRIWSISVEVAPRVEHADGQRRRWSCPSLRCTPSWDCAQTGVSSRVSVPPAATRARNTHHVRVGEVAAAARRLLLLCSTALLYRYS